MHFYTTDRGIIFLKIMLVITIILAGLIIISSAFGGIQKSARDSRRMSDITQIEKALNLYYAGASSFPIIQKETIITGDDIFSQIIQNEFTAQKVPTDPLHPTYAYSYISNYNGSDYQLKFCLETNNFPEYSLGCGNIINP